jgi:molybdenum cofactor cytidylyltransferase
MPDPFSRGIIFLATGSSQRIGAPKQMLPIGDHYLLRSVLEAMICPQLSPRLVVLGANADLIRPSLAGLPVQIFINDGWHEGIGSSIRVGMHALLRIAPRINSVIIALADQSQLSASHMCQLIDTIAVSRRVADYAVRHRFPPSRECLQPPRNLKSSDLS